MYENKAVFRILQISTIFVFLGRAWQHFFFTGPYRALLWDERRFSWVALNVFGQDWATWTTNLAVDRGVVLYSKIVAFLLLLGAVSVFFLPRRLRLARFIILLDAFLLLILSLIYWKDHFFNLSQLFEYSIQVGAPVFLIFWTNKEAVNHQRFFFLLRLVVAVSFVSHGLYALGFYPTPGTYVEMSMAILGLSEDKSLIFLHLMGALDFMAAVMILLPYTKIVRVGLIYCVIWGFATALARPIAFYYPEFWQESLFQWVYQAVFRLPHGLLPLAGLLLLRPVNTFKKRF